MSFTYNEKPQTIMVWKNGPLNLIIISHSSFIASFDCPEIVLVNENPLISL